MIKEASVHQDIKERLSSIGWQTIYRNIFQPNQIVENFFLEPLFIQSLEKINQEVLKNISQTEKEKILTRVKDLFLREENPIKTLDYLKYGIDIEIKEKDKKKILKIHLIDYKNLENNSFVYAPEAEYKGTPRNSRPDFTLFVNGIPVVIIEAKREFSTKDTYIEGLNQVIDYEKRSPKLFNFVQFAVVYADKKRYFSTFPNKDKEQRTKKLEIWRNEKKEEDIFHLLKPERVLEIIKYFTFFTKRDGNLNKIIPRYPQYYAIKKAFSRIKDYVEGKSQKNRGLIWHWQGSGKSFEMLYLTNMFIEEFFDRNPHVFVMIDRQDLEKQLNEELFIPIENTVFKSFYKKVETVKELKEIVKNIKRQEKDTKLTFKGVYLTMMHKFKKEELQEFLEKEGAIQKKEILILRDEAHRTEYGTLATVRNKIFQNSLKFAFTGTPVNKNEKSTFQEFAYPEEKEFYLDRFFIEDSIRDGFTLPLMWRSVITKDIKLNITEEEVRKILLEYDVEDTQVDPDLVRKKISVRDLLSSEDRIEKAVRYIVENIEEDTEGFNFKAFIIVNDRLACVRYKKYLDRYLKDKFENPEEISQIVMTYTPNETIQEIEEYKNSMEKKYGKKWEELNKEFAENFKKKDKNPKILIVTNMLLEGYDAPILKVIYFDKLTSDQRLLQAAARANRLYRGKRYGLIVDLTGVLIENYKKALSQYNIYEDEQIKEDIVKHAFVNTKEIFKSFQQSYSEFLKLFKEITGIEWKTFLENINKKENKREYFEEVGAKVLFSEDKNYLQIKAKETIDLFKALGAYPEKLSYLEDIEWLKIFYYFLRKKDKPRRTYIPWKEIKKELLEKLQFDPFEEIGEVEIGIEEIEKIKDEDKALKIVADLISSIEAKTEEEKTPIYKELYKRLQNIKEKLVKKQEKAINVLKQVTQIKYELDKETKKVSSLTEEEKILRNIKQLLEKEGIKDIELNNTKDFLIRFSGRKVKNKSYWDSFENSLLKDLRVVIKNMRERKKIVKEIINSIKDR